MPTITIREIDNTGSGSYSYVENTVLVPGIKVEATKDDSKITLDGFYTNKKDFTDKVDSIIDSIEDASSDITTLLEDDSITYVLTLLNQGLPVQYFGAYTDIEEAEKLNATQCSDLYEDYKDKGLYDLLFITTGVIDNINMSNAAIECAAERGDSVAILSTSSDYRNYSFVDTEDEYGNTLKVWTKSDATITYANNKKLAEAVDNTVNYNLTSAKNDVTRTGVTFARTTEKAGNYAAVFAPMFQSSSIKDYNGKAVNKLFPASLNYLVAYSSSVGKGTPEWFAIAGSVRGISPLAPIQLSEEYGDAAINIFQPRTTQTINGKTSGENHIATNVIANVKPYGNVIWGNRTMHPLSAPKSGGDVQLIASDFLNIRLLACSLKKTLYRASRTRTFEPNSDTLWFNFKNDVEPLLETMKANQGIRGYKITKIPTSKKAVLSARVTIAPIEAVEDFDFTIEFTDSIEVINSKGGK